MLHNVSWFIHLLILVTFSFFISCEKERTKKEIDYELERSDSSLVAYYTFNGNLEDQSLYQIKSEALNVALTHDLFQEMNSAAYFDGSSYIEILSEDIRNYTAQNFTISSWIKPEVESKEYVVTKTKDKNVLGNPIRGGGAFSLSFYPGTVRTIMYLYKNDPHNYILVDGKTPIKEKHWQHIALTFRDGIASVYYNGDIENSCFPDETQILQTNGNTYIGAYKWAFPNGAYAGSIDNVRIYNRALSKIEIRKLYVEFK